MIGKYPIVGFDTSSYNRLLDDGPLAEPIFAAITSALFFRCAGLSVEELVACADPARRDALLACCRRLQQGAFECIYSHGEMLRLHITAHKQNASYDWKAVDVRAREYERGIQRSDLLLDQELSELQRNDNKNRTYDDVLLKLRPKLQQIFESNGEPPPTSFRKTVARAEGAAPNLLLGIGKQLYDHAAETDSSEQTVREFTDTCPPFRVVIYALLMRWYNRAVRDPQTGEKYAAGYNDLLMAAHLPYCDKFITAEKKGEQEKCLRELATVAGLETEIVSYDEFCDSFLVTVQSASFSRPCKKEAH
jgi:hypothetical protein